MAGIRVLGRGRGSRMGWDSNGIGCGGMGVDLEMSENGEIVSRE